VSQYICFHASATQNKQPIKIHKRTAIQTESHQSRKFKDRFSGNFSINKIILNVLIESPFIIDESAALGCLTTFCKNGTIYSLLLPRRQLKIGSLLKQFPTISINHQPSAIQLIKSLNFQQLDKRCHRINALSIKLLILGIDSPH
jgi:hypothetical protein